jgi:hypothetical protein
VQSQDELKFGKCVYFSIDNPQPMSACGDAYSLVDHVKPFRTDSQQAVVVQGKLDSGRFTNCTVSL